MNIGYIKGGICLGGATLRDLNMLDDLLTLNQNIFVLTGYLNLKNPVLNKLNITVCSLLDRNENKSKGISVKDIVFFIEEWLQEHNINTIIASQVFLSDNLKLSKAILQLAKTRKVFVRLHDFSENIIENMKARNITFLVTSEFMKKIILNKNKNLDVKVLTCYINFSRYKPYFKKQYLRSYFGLKPNNFVLFQPTRVDCRKRIDRTLYFAYYLKQYFIKHKINKVPLVCVAGGCEVEDIHIKEKQKLIDLAKDLDVKIVFMNGLVVSDIFENTPCFRICDVLNISDFVCFMSDTEGFGLIPLEAAFMRKPVVVYDYKDIFTNSFFMFREIYAKQGFDFFVLKKDVPDYNFVKKVYVKIIQKGYKQTLNKNKALALKYYNNKIGIKKLREIFNV